MKHLPEKYAARNKAVILLSKIVEGIDDPEFYHAFYYVLNCLPAGFNETNASKLASMFHKSNKGFYRGKMMHEKGKFTEGKRELAAFLLRHIDQLGYHK